MKYIVLNDDLLGNNIHAVKLDHNYTMNKTQRITIDKKDYKIGYPTEIPDEIVIIGLSDRINLKGQEIDF